MNGRLRHSQIILALTGEEIRRMDADDSAFLEASAKLRMCRKLAVCRSPLSPPESALLSPRLRLAQLFGSVSSRTRMDLQ
jgi:hypothetical protein